MSDTATGRGAEQSPDREAALTNVLDDVHTGLAAIGTPNSDGRLHALGRTLAGETTVVSEYGGPVEINVRRISPLMRLGLAERFGLDAEFLAGQRNIEFIIYPAGRTSEVRCTFSRSRDRLELRQPQDINRLSYEAFRSLMHDVGMFKEPTRTERYAERAALALGGLGLWAAATSVINRFVKPK